MHQEGHRPVLNQLLVDTRVIGINQKCSESSFLKILGQGLLSIVWASVINLNHIMPIQVQKVKKLVAGKKGEPTDPRCHSAVAVLCFTGPRSQNTYGRKTPEHCRRLFVLDAKQSGIWSELGCVSISLCTWNLLKTALNRYYSITGPYKKKNNPKVQGSFACMHARNVTCHGRVWTTMCLRRCTPFGAFGIVLLVCSRCSPQAPTETFLLTFKFRNGVPTKRAATMQHISIVPNPAVASWLVHPAFGWEQPSKIGESASHAGLQPIDYLQTMLTSYS